MRNNVGQFLAKRAALNPELEALVDVGSGRRITYSELNRGANRIVHLLRGLGVGRGDRFAILSRNRPEFLQFFYALAKLGAAAIPLNWRLVGPELAFIVDDAGPVGILYEDCFDALVEELETHRKGAALRHRLRIGSSGLEGAGNDDREPTVEAGDDDLLYIMYTSGTTGRPKGAMHTHATAIWAAVTVAATLDMRPKDRSLVPLPLFHVGALSAVTGHMYRGITSVLLQSFDPIEAWKLVESERITIASAVPAMLDAMLAVYDASRDHSSLRWCVVGASPVPVDLIEAYAERGIELLQIYGLTESCGPACVLQPEHARRRVGSTGKAFFHTTVRVIDESGRDVSVGEIGEIVVSGPHVMKGYWNRPEATAETLRDGWLHTGDAASVDEDGFVYIRDRIKDLIISGGENVYPAEVEEVLRGHAGVREVAVVGRPSRRWGESPVAVVVRSEPALSEEVLLEFCQGRLARFKQPVAIEFVSDLPRNASGKVLKQILREQFGGVAPAEAR